MQICAGYEIVYECPQPTPMVLSLNIHYTRASDLVVPDHLVTTPPVPIAAYRDAFGNWCNRILAPAGRIRLYANSVISDDGRPDPVVRSATQHHVQDLPDYTLAFLLASRYCETDLLFEDARKLFNDVPSGWSRVQAICDFVHRQVRSTDVETHTSRTAWETWNERMGASRDMTHLAITLCRCMDIPARYCTGYLSQIGVPPESRPIAFATWFEAYLEGRWHTFDPYNNVPRIGRILIARGRDAADVTTPRTFGPGECTTFRVWTDEVTEGSH